VKSEYGFAKMEVGDSILVTADEGENFGAMALKVRPAISYWSRRHPGQKFKPKKVSNRSIRLWRIE
jgi:hypothetical protein